MAKKKSRAVDMWKPDYPTNPNPPHCPTCKQRLPSDHAMITVDESKLTQATKKSKSKSKGRAYKSATEDAVRGM